MAGRFCRRPHTFMPFPSGSAGAAATEFTWVSTALAAAGIGSVLTAKAEALERAVAAVRNHTNM